MRMLEGELVALCERCGVPPEKMSLERAQMRTGLSGVKVSVLGAMGMDVVSGLLGVVLAVVGASICGGGGVALVGTGPVGMIAGASAGALLAILGKDSMEKLVKGISFPVILRQMVTDSSVRRGIERQREAIERAIVSALADPRNGFAARLTESLSGTLGAQMETMAKNAEMSICA